MRTRIIVIVLIILAIGFPVFADSGLVLSGNAGFDVIGLGWAAGAGVGYEISNLEAGLIFMFSGGKNNYDEAVYKGTYSYSFSLIGVRATYKFGGAFATKGLFPYVGTGFFFMGYSFKDEWILKATSTPGVDQNDLSASGALAILGLGYRLSDAFDVRFEVPVLIFFGSYGRTSVAVPILLSGVYHLTI
jgi:hypothetical protein